MMWNEILNQEAETGEIPLPIVESIRLDEGGQQPTIVLIAPDVVPGATYVFVNVQGLPPADGIALRGLLKALMMGRQDHLKAVFHSSGLDYEFVFSSGQVINLHDLPPEEQETCWGILRAIALLGASHPDVKASQVKLPRAS